jgi:isocitrate dehydrogenase
MKNGAVSGANYIGGAAGYNVVAVGDYNGDGASDILFQSASSGVLVDWTLTNSIVTGTHVMAGSVSGYKIF